jgi:hypothetical protein
MSGGGVGTSKRRIAKAKEVAERRLNEPTMGDEHDAATFVLVACGVENGADANREFCLRFGLGLEPMKSPVTLLERAPLSHELLGFNASIIAAPLFEVSAWCYCKTKAWG